mmetsp:Transcript_25181/g.49208  ORF Transcript_25181/g.49208 Transcript_25181/m.49208 type:complete len:143 (-) Transcript_25181:830-1258(-)
MQPPLLLGPLLFLSKAMQRYVMERRRVAQDKRLFGCRDKLLKDGTALNKQKRDRVKRRAGSSLREESNENKDLSTSNSWSNRHTKKEPSSPLMADTKKEPSSPLMITCPSKKAVFFQTASLKTPLEIQPSDRPSPGLSPESV